MPGTEALQIELPYYSDKVKTINPFGHVGILTLWSKVETIVGKLQKYGAMPSCVAAIANLYGDGISQLIANLLWNPQITKLYVIGNNRTGSLQELAKFLQDGVEQVTINGSAQLRIRGTTRLVNPALTGPELFGGHVPQIIDMSIGQLDASIADLHQALTRETAPVIQRARKELQLADPKMETMPSLVADCQIVGDNALDAWAELLFAINRFGLVTVLKKGMRKELLNVKVLIKDPGWQPDSDYAKFNLDGQKMRQYAEAMLCPDLGDDITYTYGHRLKRYYGFDLVGQAITRLVSDPSDRKCFISIWDSYKDLYDRNADGTARGHPCWVGLFLRALEGRLYMSATFRTHRAYTAWIENVHGLMQLQAYICGELERQGVKLCPGPITVYSQSISIDPGQVDMVGSILGTRKWTMRDDGRGELTFSVDGKKALVEHRLGGLVLKRYEGSNFEALAHRLSQDLVVSDLSHAIYLGRQLGKLEMCLKNGLEYEEK